MSDYLSDFNAILEEAQGNNVTAGELLESQALEEYLAKYPDVFLGDWLLWYSDEEAIRSRALWDSSSGGCGWLNAAELAPTPWEASAAVQAGRDRWY